MLGPAENGVREISLQSLRELLDAHQHARHFDADQWQFAVELTELRAGGLSRTNIRRLIHEGLVKHAFETTDAGSPHREFVHTPAAKFTDASCFVLTGDGVEFAMRVCGTTPVQVRLPTWNCQNRELTFEDELIKRYRVPAQNQEAILCAFQEEAWTWCVDDPLPPIPEQCPKRRLHDTIKSLNRHHRRQVIRFKGDGTGERVIWEFSSVS